MMLGPEPLCAACGRPITADEAKANMVTILHETPADTLTGRSFVTATHSHRVCP